MKRFLVGLLAGAALMTGLGASASPSSIRVRIPHCAEDAPYLQGRGDFDGRRWDRYVCLHIDEVQVKGQSDGGTDE